MRFVPNYCVSYHGAFHNAGCAFEIDREDAEEMSRHGTVIQEAAVPDQQIEPDMDGQTRRGRPKKTEA